MLEILKYPNPDLKKKSEGVTKFDEELAKFLDEMAQTMYAEKGVGLAAPQVGRRSRAFIIDLGPQENTPNKLYEFINPKLSNGQGKISFEEGCLSLPGVTEKISRHEKITVDYQDRKGEKHTLHAEGLLAVALQHENDHLDGILIVDRLSPLKRRLVKKKLSKAVVL